MGAQQSTISPEKFQNQIFSIILYHIAPQANPNLKFVTRDRCQADNLPIPDDPDLSKLLNFYDIRDPQVKAYLDQHVLNSEENLIRFYQTLIHLIRDPNQSSSKESKTKKHQQYDQDLKNEYSKYISTRSKKAEKPDRLTRSHLNRIESRPPSLAPFVRSPQAGGSRPERNSERPTHSALNTTNRSSHFTMTKVVSDKQPPKDEEIDLDQVRQKLIVNLLNRQEQFTDDYEEDEEENHEEENHEEENHEEENQPRERSHQSREKSHQSRERSHRSRERSHHEEISETRPIPSEHRGKLNQSLNHSERSRRRRDSINLNDEETLKHKRRFKEKCVIQENFD